MRTSFCSAALLLGALACADLAQAGDLVSRTLPAGPDPGSRERQYQMFVPDGLSDQTAAPVIMVLHGCLQNEQNMIDETGFTELAEREGFMIVFPFITSYPFLPARAQNCWGFFIEQQRHEGRGEASDLRRILAAVEDEFGTDPERRYVAGLSSGAAMAVVMAVAYSEDIAAAGAVAGLPYGENACAVRGGCWTGIAHRPVSALIRAMAAEQQSPEEQRLVPIMVIHSTNDRIVPIRNAYNLRDAWITYYDADPTPARTEDCTTEGVPCARTRFTDRQARAVVETVLYDGASSGATHYWVGDNKGTFADPDGPSASELLWSFFREHTLAAAAPADAQALPAAVEGMGRPDLGTAGAARKLPQTR